jgi:hypothetical protein
MKAEAPASRWLLLVNRILDMFPCSSWCQASLPRRRACPMTIGGSVHMVSIMLLSASVPAFSSTVGWFCEEREESEDPDGRDERDERDGMV